MRCPGRGGTFRYGRPWTYHCLPSLAFPDMRTPHPAPSLLAAEDPVHHAADDPLLARDVGARVDHTEVEVSRELVVDVQNPALEDPEALHRVPGQPQIHAGLVILELRAAAEQPVERDVDRNT